MSAALFIALSLVASGACAAASWGHCARIAALTGGDARVLARSLRALPGEARLAELLRRSRPGRWEHRLARAVLDAEGEPARVAAANDLLAEAAHRLEAGAAWPPAAVRLSAFAALLLATLSFLAGAGTVALVAVLAVGAAGAAASAAGGRSGRIAADRQREAIDALVAAAVGPLAPLDARAGEERRAPGRSAARR
ncbi:MAG: hypothetical protein IT372_28240 [Polyangiaceae bacterium]|nr:hypothetical protein [Polyangiaceae bacterium]